MPLTYLVANWKSNKTRSEAVAWLDAVALNWLEVPDHLTVILCAPFIHLELIKTKLPQVKLGAQNLSPYPDGAYTGEISARMLEGIVDYALLGHSERRQHFGETNSQVALKVTQALEHHLTPIVSVSDSTWASQLHAIDHELLSNSIIMYEPPEAISQQTGPIGVGDAAPVDQVLNAIDQIQEMAPGVPVLYGGSVKSDNLPTYLHQSRIAGVVPGSASLNAAEWLKLLQLAIDIRG